MAKCELRNDPVHVGHGTGHGVIPKVSSREELFGEGKPLTASFSKFWVSLMVLKVSFHYSMF